MKSKIAFVLCSLICAFPALLFISCNTSNETGGNMIVTNKDGVAVEVEGKVSDTYHNMENMFDGNPSTYYGLLMYTTEQNFLCTKIVIPDSNSSIISIYVKIKINPISSSWTRSKKAILSYVTTDGMEYTLCEKKVNIDASGGQEILIEQEFPIYNNISYFKLSSENVTSITRDLYSFYDFIIHSAPLGELSFKDESGRTCRNLDWDEGYTPLQYCGSDGKVHNVLLVPYFSAAGLPQYQSLASPVRFALTNGPDGDFPSEKVREYAEKTFPYHKCNILAVAGRPL